MFSLEAGILAKRPEKTSDGKKEKWPSNGKVFVAE
jgi:hypothetical protein